eukprot:SAG31_NODE_1234_length_9204_cov_9.297748_3_plen_174_part_00
MRLADGMGPDERHQVAIAHPEACELLANCCDAIIPCRKAFFRRADLGRLVFGCINPSKGHLNMRAAERLHCLVACEDPAVRDAEIWVFRQDRQEDLSGELKASIVMVGLLWLEARRGTLRASDRCLLRGEVRRAMPGEAEQQGTVATVVEPPASRGGERLVAHQGGQDQSLAI